MSFLKKSIYLGIISGLHITAQAQTIDSTKAVPQNQKKVKNVILMIGDGTGLAQWSAAQACIPQKLKVFSLAEYLGLSLTSSSNDYITDSGAGATAFSIGQKTYNGAIGVTKDSHPEFTIAEKLHVKGKSTGLVATCGLTHATPASFYGHQASRKMDKEIANDFYSGFIDIAIGGGYPFFDTAKLRESGHTVYMGTKHLDTVESKHFISFYSTAEDVPKFSKGRGDFERKASLAAIRNLNKNKNGFFLMIEGSQIDWGGHDNDSNYVLNEVLDFDSTIEAVVNWAKKDGETLVIITADHETGGLSLVGYDKKNQKPAMHFSTHHHTGIPVPVFAVGPGAQLFSGVYENTEIYYKILQLLQMNSKE
jgi:alkaline phosphatase